MISVGRRTTKGRNAGGAGKQVREEVVTTGTGREREGEVGVVGGERV